MKKTSLKFTCIAAWMVVVLISVGNVSAQSDLVVGDVSSDGHSSASLYVSGTKSSVHLRPLTQTEANNISNKLNGLVVNIGGVWNQWDSINASWKPMALPLTTDQDASNDLITSTNFGGDVTGTYLALSVGKIQGRDVSTTAPTSNQVFQWNGSAWTPTTLPAYLQTEADSIVGNEIKDTVNTYSFLVLTGSGTTNSPYRIGVAPGASSGQFLYWDGSKWDHVALSSGAGISISGNQITNTGDVNAGDDITTSTNANGDLGGIYPSPSVQKIKGRAFDTTGLQPGDLFQWNGTSFVPFTPNYLTSETSDGDSALGNELSDTLNSGGVFTLSGAGTNLSPKKLGFLQGTQNGDLLYWNAGKWNVQRFFYPSGSGYRIDGNYAVGGPPSTSFNWLVYGPLGVTQRSVFNSDLRVQGDLIISNGGSSNDSVMTDIYTNTGDMIFEVNATPVASGIKRNLLKINASTQQITMPGEVWHNEPSQFQDYTWNTIYNRTLSNGANNTITIDTIGVVDFTGPTASYDISGFTNGVEGRILEVFLNVTQSCTLNHNSASVATNGFYFMSLSNRTFTGRAILTFRYRNTPVGYRWTLISVNEN